MSILSKLDGVYVKMFLGQMSIYDGWHLGRNVLGANVCLHYWGLGGGRGSSHGMVQLPTLLLPAKANESF